MTPSSSRERSSNTLTLVLGRSVEADVVVRDATLSRRAIGFAIDALCVILGRVPMFVIAGPERAIDGVPMPPVIGELEEVAWQRRRLLARGEQTIA